ncbi:MAG: peptide chain release factor 1 [Candidatus Omnitrophica bacterium]|nr:peptide chain release factor 1 [Candidatus Omnitrophota bacterium]
MFERLEKIEERYRKLQEFLASPETLADKNLYSKYAREFAGLAEIVNKHKKYKSVLQEVSKVQTMLKDKEHQQDKDFLELAHQELTELDREKRCLESELEEMFVAEEGGAHKNIIVEIRAGTGGEEAALFVGDLYRMYTKYAAKSGWKMEVMSSRPTAIGGFKEIIFSLQGKGVFRRLKYESGVHRVQRVPATETQGRIHTSAVSVAVLPEPEEVEVKIDPKDIRIDVYRSAGHGGQSVNTTDSAVRITHIPTEIVVSCQDERSQMKNKVKAMRVLRARLLDKMQTEQQNKISQSRKSQVGSGDRSEKIRTYNFPGRRVTDHRIGLTVHKLEAILDGNLNEVVAVLIQEDKKRKLKTWKEE